MELCLSHTHKNTLILVLFSVALTACQSSTAMTHSSSGSAAMNTDKNTSNHELVSSSLDKETVQGLLLMYEEEKLARDVYAVLYEKWQIPSFDRIGQTEVRHNGAVITLLERYQIGYPDSLPQGQFKDTQLQAAYDKLIAQGLQSPNEALRVGAYVEELDIDDLQRLTTLDLPDDIKNTYDWLLLGSRNHLRAFNNGLVQRGIEYVPQILSKKDFDAIVNSPKERGMGMGQGSGQGRGRF